LGIASAFTTCNSFNDIFQSGQIVSVPKF